MARRIDSAFDGITRNGRYERDDYVDRALEGGSAPHYAHQLARCNDVMVSRAETLQRQGWTIERLQGELAAAREELRQCGRS